MAPSHTTLRAISRLAGKSQRASHREPHFPLTPALSLRERENPPLTFITPGAVSGRRTFPNNRTSRRLFPLPAGEGEGEGNRLAVQHSDSDLPEMSNFASSGRAGGFLMTMRRRENEKTPRLARRLCRIRA